MSILVCVSAEEQRPDVHVGIFFNRSTFFHRQIL